MNTTAKDVAESLVAIFFKLEKDLRHCSMDFLIQRLNFQWSAENSIPRPSFLIIVLTAYATYAYQQPRHRNSLAAVICAQFVTFMEQSKFMRYFCSLPEHLF